MKLMVKNGVKLIIVTSDYLNDRICKIKGEEVSQSFVTEFWD